MRPGRPNNTTYVTSWGETLSGAYAGKDGRLRPIGSDRPTFSLNDEARAVHRFKRWQAEQGDNSDPLAEYVTEKSERVPPLVKLMYPKLSIVESETSSLARDYYRTLILTDPQRAALELDVAHLANHPAKPEKPEFTLEELGAKYLAEARNKQGKPLAPKHIVNSRQMWNQFCDQVGVTYPRDLTKEILVSYSHFVEALKLSASSTRNRFVKVKAVLNWGIKKTDDEKDLRFALDLCDKVLDLPEVESNPQPINVADLHRLLNAADERMKAILLLTLNGAFHGGEVLEVLTKEIQLNKQTLATRRSKNRYPRVAWLWERTVEAIRDYQTKHPHSMDVLFATYPKKNKPAKPLNTEGRRQLFVTLRKQVGIPSSVTMEGFRDAAYTIAEEVDAHHARFLAGHKTGMSDKYVLRQATNKKVVACCEAIERYYFGGKK